MLIPPTVVAAHALITVVIQWPEFDLMVPALTFPYRPR